MLTFSSQPVSIQSLLQVLVRLSNVKFSTCSESSKIVVGLSLQGILDSDGDHVAGQRLTYNIGCGQGACQAAPINLSWLLHQDLKQQAHRASLGQDRALSWTALS